MPVPSIKLIGQVYIAFCASKETAACFPVLEISFSCSTFWPLRAFELEKCANLE